MINIRPAQPHGLIGKFGCCSRNLETVDDGMMQGLFKLCYSISCADRTQTTVHSPKIWGIGVTRLAIRLTGYNTILAAL